MNDEKLLELLAPIKEYILNNELDRDDIHIVVANHFPSEAEVAKIAVFIKTNVPNAFKMVQPDKIITRTRQILTQALEQSAYEVWERKYGGKLRQAFLSQEEIDDAMGAEMFWEDEYGHGENYDE